MIMITGGLGFIGANLGSYLLEEGESVLLTRHRKSKLPSFLEPEKQGRLSIQDCDVRNFDQVLEVIRTYKIKSIVHGVSIYQPTENPRRVFQVNVEGTMNVVEAARSAGVKLLTFMSSRAVYTGGVIPNPVPEREEISIHARDYVPLSKKMGEILVLYYRRKLGMDIRIARIARVYGPLSEAITNPIHQMVESSIRSVPVKIPLPPEYKEDFVYVKDCARGIGLVHLAQSPKHYIYNVGAGQASLLSDVAAIVQKIIPSAQINFDDSSSRAFDEKFERNLGGRNVDIKRITEEFGYRPQYGIDKGIESYIQWLKKGDY